MVSTISRNTYRRYILRNLCSYTQHHLIPAMAPSPPSIQPFLGILDILQSRFKPTFPLLGVIHTSNLSHRYLSSSAVTPENQVSKNPVEANSKGGEESGEKSHSSGNARKPVRGGPVSWLSFVLLFMTGAVLIDYADREKKRHIKEITSSSAIVKEGPSVGKAAIGGPFNLVNHYGKPVTEKDFLGKWSLIYFGFTHCPDICPDELLKLAAAIDKIKKKAGLEVVPVFISVDPERDNVKQVHEYVKEFHPNLIGLTGTVEETRKVARAYRVYYMKTEEEGSDYLVDHSIVMYLMSPEMEFVKFFGKNNDVDALAEGVIKEITEYQN